MDNTLTALFIILTFLYQLLFKHTVVLYSLRFVRADYGGHIGHREGGACGDGRGRDVGHVVVTWCFSQTAAAAAATTATVTRRRTTLVHHALWRHQPTVRRHDLTDDVTAGASACPPAV